MIPSIVLIKSSFVQDVFHLSLVVIFFKFSCSLNSLQPAYILLKIWHIKLAQNFSWGYGATGCQCIWSNSNYRFISDMIHVDFLFYRLNTLYQKLFIQHASGLSLLKRNNYLPAYDTSINTLEYHLPVILKSTHHDCWLVFTFWFIITYRPSPAAQQDLPHLLIWFLPLLCILQLDFIFLISIHLSKEFKAKAKQWQRGKRACSRFASK